MDINIRDGMYVVCIRSISFFVVQDIEKWQLYIEGWEYLVERQTIIHKAYTICREELYLGDFVRLDNSEV